MNKRTDFYEQKVRPFVHTFVNFVVKISVPIDNRCHFTLNMLYLYCLKYYNSIGGYMGFFDKLKQGLSKTKSSFDEKINNVFSNFRKVDEDLLE